MESDKTKKIITRFVKNTAIDIYRKNKRYWENASLDELSLTAESFVSPYFFLSH